MTGSIQRNKLALTDQASKI